MSSKQNEDFINRKLAYESRLRKLANTIHSAVNINAILIGSKQQIQKLYHAEFVTIYLLDNKRKEIFSRVKDKESVMEIRLPITGSSIAGFVAKTRRVVNIRNVYDSKELMGIDPDIRFNSSWDKKTGAKTRQVLAAPIAFKETLIGVIQLVNRQDQDFFTAEDQNLLSDVSEILGIAFHNQFRSSKKFSSKYDRLIFENIISKSDLEKAREMAREKRKNLDEVLTESFNIAKKDLRSAYAHFYNVGYVDPNDMSYQPVELMKGKKLNYFRKSRWFPLELKEDTLIAAIDDPHDYGRIQEIEHMYGTARVELRYCLPDDITQFFQNLKPIQTISTSRAPERSLDEILDTMKGNEDFVMSEEDEEEDDLDNFNDNSVVLLARKIIDDSYTAGASDIHIEPYNPVGNAVVRIRVDGSCKEMLSIPKTYVKGVVSRIKILAKLDIAEKRKPQDGKIKFRSSSGKEVELRVATIPTVNNNEDIVMRILASSEPLPLDKIMPSNTFKRFSEVVKKPYGIVLVVGPTGSGKTTTLHSALGFINKPERKIWTAEDPVEITQYRLRQVQVNSKIGYTFEAAMRAFLRADPDVIMVGEMRDKETMGMGIEASLTGHLVFSTLHTNSAPETITRLMDMGLDPFHFADAILGILAQRLVKKLCTKCKEAYHPDKKEYDKIKELYGEMFDYRMDVPYSPDLTFYRPKGCEACDHSGYKGRLGLYEFLEGTEAMKNKIIQRALVEELRKIAIMEGMATLLQDGIRNVFEGITDLRQVLSVCAQ